MRSTPSAKPIRGVNPYPSWRAVSPPRANTPSGLSDWVVMVAVLETRSRISWASSMNEVSLPDEMLIAEPSSTLSMVSSTQRTQSSI